uniref:POPDC1-3 domain-containing protein n=1 Tax=Anopheles atroparvus TaxID=41427 RepID=A0AAG5DVR5_ANOAO
MLLWGWFVNCSLDAVVWFGGFLVVNTIYVVILLCKIRPVKFDREIESVYIALFKPLRVSRHQFKKVLNCMKIVRSLKFQEIYVQEKITKVDSLSLVLSGKLVISQNQKAHHIVFPHQFLDSPEWFGVSTDDFFQVSIMAIEESRVLIWHRDKLKLSMIAEPFLQSVFDHILGRDVVKKLMQVTQVCEIMASNGCVPAGYGDDAEDKPMLATKGKGGDNGGHGLTALINRQLQDASIPLLPMGPTKHILNAPRSVPAVKRRPIYPDNSTSSSPRNSIELEYSEFSAPSVTRSKSLVRLECTDNTGPATDYADLQRPVTRRPNYPKCPTSSSSRNDIKLEFSAPGRSSADSKPLVRLECTDNTGPATDYADLQRPVTRRPHYPRRPTPSSSRNDIKLEFSAPGRSSSDSKPLVRLECTDNTGLATDYADLQRPVTRRPNYPRRPISSSPNNMDVESISSEIFAPIAPSSARSGADSKPLP